MTLSIHHEPRDKAEIARVLDTVHIPDLPGIEPWDIAGNLSEYLALREVEKWAKKNLGT